MLRLLPMNDQVKDENLITDLEDVSYRTRYMISDQDEKLPALFDAILKDTGIEVMLTGIRVPRANPTMQS
ncbi:hypothetical protein [Saccharopolyspora shandongensis]|uniref:hypothetical protein n=1 Tax=Saccharopolyspora shandongensis TaxID=418495 RepID=UPI0033FAB93A